MVPCVSPCCRLLRICLQHILSILCGLHFIAIFFYAYNFEFCVDFRFYLKSINAIGILLVYKTTKTFMV